MYDGTVALSTLRGPLQTMSGDSGASAPNPSEAENEEGRTSSCTDTKREHVDVSVTWQEFDSAGRPL